MKKLVTVTLSIVAMCALTACGTSKNQTEATTEAISYEDDYAEITPIELNASEYVELGEYKGLTVTVEKMEVTDEAVEEELQNFVEGYVDYEEILDRDVVEEGDFVNLDYTCTIAGKKNDEYSDEDLDVKAGDGEINNYLGAGLDDDFDLESKVIGADIGSTISIDFTFPKDYDDEAVSGKKCKMDVIVNSISKEVIPELTDAFVKENTDCDTVAEYRKQIRQTLEEEADAETEGEAQEEMWNQIVDNAKQKKDFTKDMIQQEIENVKLENQEFVEMYLGMDVEEYLTETWGMTMEEIAQQSLKGQCVQDLLVEAEKISVSDKDVDKEMETIAEETGFESVDEVKEYYTEEEVRSNLILTKLYDKLLGYTTIKTEPVSASEEDEAIEIEE